MNLMLVYVVPYAMIHRKYPPLKYPHWKISSIEISSAEISSAERSSAEISSTEISCMEIFVAIYDRKRGGYYVLVARN